MGLEMIVMNDFRAEPPELREAMLDAARRVIESGWYVLGNEVETFERKWADSCGMPCAIGVGNGMDAIEIALRCLNISAGDEVITTAMTAFATVLAILRAGAIPVLADIDPNTALLSLDSVKRCIGPKTKAIILVHLYGQMRQMSTWVDFCKEQGIHLIEDCAQAHLATWNGKIAGSFGVAGAYSFYPTKNLGALGDAGMLVTNRIDLAKRAKYLRNYGQTIRYYHPELGMNSRLDEMQAAILSERMGWLQQFTERRRTIAQNYYSKIGNHLVTQLVPPDEVGAHVYHLYVILCSQRNELQRHLEQHGVQALIHYPIPVHRQDPCANLRRDPNGLSASEYHSDRCLSLPCHPQMSNEDVDRVVGAVNSFRSI